jgi:hypothetical protein
MVRDVLQVPSLVTFDATGQVVEVRFNASDPWAIELVNAWRPVLNPLGVTVGLAKMQLVSHLLPAFNGFAH